MQQSQTAMLNAIDKMRDKMIAAARETGFNSEETMYCSQELDKLIYEYQTACQAFKIRRGKDGLLFQKAVFLTKKENICVYA